MPAFCTIRGFPIFNCLRHKNMIFKLLIICITRWLHGLLNICPFTTMKLCSIAFNYCQSRFKILLNGN